MTLARLGNLFVQKLLPKNTAIPLKYAALRPWEFRLPHQPIKMTVAKDIYDAAGDAILIRSGTPAKVVFPPKQPEKLPFPYFLNLPIPNHRDLAEFLHPPVKRPTGHGSLATFDCKNIRFVVFDPEHQAHIAVNGDMVMLNTAKRNLSDKEKLDLLEKAQMGPGVTAYTVEDTVLDVFNIFPNGWPQPKP